MKEKLLQMLNDAGGYVSGEKISRELGVTRSYIWKVIAKLKDEGYVISSVRNKGYRLEPASDKLDEASVRKGLTTASIGQHIVYLDNVDSTNEYAKNLDAPHGTVVIAEDQTMGKGRRGKSWVSQPGTGLWMTIYLKPSIKPQEIMQVTLISGMAVCKAIQQVTGCNAGIKWPNDIVINGKKVCGILTEMILEEQTIACAVTGIGININIPSFPQELSNRATSLLIETGKTFLRADIARAVFTYFEQYYTNMLDPENLPSLLSEYASMCINVGREVVATIGNQEIHGVAEGISPLGELLIKTPDGAVIPVTSGEVSIRGVYGYI